MALHVTVAHEDYSTLARVSAGLLSWVALISLAWAPVRTMPALAICIGYFYFALGAPIFSRSALSTIAGRLRLSTDAIDQATIAALLFACVTVAVALVTDRGVRRTAWNLTRKIDGSNPFTPADVMAARIFAGFSLAFNLAVVLRLDFGAFAQPIYLFSSPIISLTLLYWNAERTGSTRDRYLYWTAIAFTMGAGMLTGMLGNAMTPGIVAGSLMWAGKGRLPLGLLAIGIALMLFLNPVKGVYRELTWFGRERHITTLDRALLWGVAVERTYGRNSEFEQDVNKSVTGTMSRFSTLSQVAQIFDWVPDRVPFAGPERWLALPMLAVPRLFWPEKPSPERYFNKNYTHTFKLQTRRQSGSVTLPTVGDGYWRLGWLGVVLEASLLGLIVGAAQGVSRGGSRSALLLAGSLLQLRPDSQIVNTINGTIQQVFVALIVTWVASVLARLFMDAPSTDGAARPSPVEDLV